MPKSTQSTLAGFSVIIVLVGIAAAVAQEADVHRLTDEQVESFALLALDGLNREYPNKPANVMQSAADVRSPQEMHPAFYGNFDWHSSVHAHWMLARLLRLHPEANVAEQIRDTLRQQLTLDNMTAEAAYFEADSHFERMYGWAWLLQLVRELHTWEDPDASQWRSNLKPLEAKIVALIGEYLPKLSFPIRVGTHMDTAFALGMELDYARAVQNASLEKLVLRKAKEFYRHDRNYPAHYEPSGHDFFSPGFNEADLMRRVLSATEFSNWLDQFLPQLRGEALGSMIEPVKVPDVADGHLVHLAGLDLSRAWTMKGIGSSLAADDPRRKTLEQAIPVHATLGLSYVTSGHYEGEHWLATFAVYYLTDSGLEVVLE